MRTGPPAVQLHVGAVRYLYHARAQAVQVQAYNARVRHHGGRGSAGQNPVHGPGEARERLAVRLGAGQGQIALRRAAGVQLGIAGAYLSEGEAVPFARVLLGQAVNDRDRQRKSSRRLHRAAERAGVNLPDPAAELARQQEGLHASHRSQGQFASPQTYADTAGEVGPAVTYQISFPHEKSSPKYVSNCSAANFCTDCSNL